MHGECNRQKACSLGKVSFAMVSRELQVKHPHRFGVGTPGLDSGLTRQQVRQIILRAAEGEVCDGRGRPPALPEAIVLLILTAFASVVSLRKTVISAPMLQPINLPWASFWRPVLARYSTRSGARCSTAKHRCSNMARNMTDSVAGKG